MQIFRFTFQFLSLWLHKIYISFYINNDQSNTLKYIKYIY